MKKLILIRIKNKQKITRTKIKKVKKKTYLSQHSKLYICYNNNNNNKSSTQSV